MESMEIHLTPKIGATPFLISSALWAELILITMSLFDGMDSGYVTSTPLTTKMTQSFTTTSGTTFADSINILPPSETKSSSSLSMKDLLLLIDKRIKDCLNSDNVYPFTVMENVSTKSHNSEELLRAIDELWNGRCFKLALTMTDCLIIREIPSLPHEIAISSIESFIAVDNATRYRDKSAFDPLEQTMYQVQILHTKQILRLGTSEMKNYL